jgi:hypothetical protein
MPSLKGALQRIGNSLRFGRHNHRSVFSHIFESRYWGDYESVSGLGSRMTQTEVIRAQLPLIIEKYQVKTLFDAPCGDLNWMKAILETTDVDYIGGDIVPEVVELARLNSPNPAYRFSVFDIAEDPFPTADLWLCRDVLFHLSFATIWKALDNFCASGVPLMLVTTHTDSAVKNRNIVTGDFRYLDLFKPPFSLPATMVLERFADFAPPAPPRDMILIRREDLAAHIRTLRR